MAFLSRPDGAPFTVAAGKPRPGQDSGQDYASFPAKNTTLSTSSDVSHSYRGEDGVLYCHIIDPRTGCPLNTPAEGGAQKGAASVSLLADSAALGDALTTALCLMGPEEALRLLAGRPEMMVMAVYRDGREELELVTNMAPETLRVLDGSCLPASEAEEDGTFRYTGSYMRE